jgi:hypothetical protein
VRKFIPELDRSAVGGRLKQSRMKPTKDRLYEKFWKEKKYLLLVLVHLPNLRSIYKKSLICHLLIMFKGLKESYVIGHHHRLTFLAIILLFVTLLFGVNNVEATM